MTSDENVTPKATDVGPDNRLQFLNSRRGWQLGILAPAVVLFLFATWIITGTISITEAGVVTFDNDFRIFWAAARLALIEGPLSVFNVEKIAETHGMIDERWMPWAYPPTYLVAFLPFGAMPFAVAWIVFSILSLIAILAATRPFSGNLLPVWLGFAFAPAFAPALFNGQNSILWTAGLLGALASIRSGRPILAGFLIGLLTLKPQLGLLIPVALIASGAWRTIIAATVTTIVLSVAASLYSGLEYWSDLREMMHLHFSTIRYSIIDNDLMTSSYSVLAALGLPVSVALVVQWCITLFSAIIVAIAWRNPRICFDLKAAILIITITLSTPYLWYYETALLAPAALFMIRAGVLQNNLPGMALAAVMWLGLGPQVLLVIYNYSPSFRFAFAPIVLLAFATCLWAIYTRLKAAHPLAGNREELP